MATSLFLIKPVKERPAASFAFSLPAFLSVIFAGTGLLFMGGMLCTLVFQSLPVFKSEGWRFLISADWFFRKPSFGAAAMIYGSVVVSAIAVLVAGPLAVGAAIFTSEFLGGKVRSVVKGMMELLAVIPSVVYGLLGVLFLRPLIYEVFKPWAPESGDNLITAGLLLGIMILPTIMSLSDDSFRSISREERNVAGALGLNKAEVFFHAVLPRALPGLVSAFLLGIGRALGETVAVYLVVGRADNRLPDPWYSFRPLLEAGQTITSKLSGSEVNLAYGNNLHWSAMMGLAFVLFAMVILFVSLGRALMIFHRRRDL